MTTTTTTPLPAWVRLGPLVAFLTGLVLLFLGERALGGMPRGVISGLGGAALIFSLFAAVWRRRESDGDWQAAATRLLVEYSVGALAVLLYLAQSDVLSLISGEKLPTILQVLWPTLLLLVLLPALAMELALLGMARAPRLELWRVRFAGNSARIVALAVVIFAGLNFVANRWNEKLDLSYFKTTAAGSATVALVRHTTTPLEFTLFFPPGNDVLEQARDYIDDLAGHSRLANVSVVDQALAPELARKLKVRGNGYLAITHDEKTETIRLGLEVEDARGTLRQLDGKVQQALLKVLRPARIAYFTTGHLERDYSAAGDDKRLGMRDFRQLLEMLGFKVKRLGLGEGLGTAVPDDASLVIIAGPLEPFLPEERAALAGYLDRGGALFVLVDPDTGALENELLGRLGVQVSKALVANERYLVRVQERAESPYYLATTRASAHPTVDTIAQGGGRLATVLLGTGALSKADPAPPEVKVTFTLRAMPQSWLDTNGNGKQDADEKKDSLDFAAAIERPNAAGADGSPVKDLRAIVVADADVAGDGLVANAGNGYFLSDCVRWLVNDEDTAGTTETEEDVPIVHKKDEDTKWFYGTSFVFPAAILGGGLFLSRRRRGAVRGA